MTNPTISPTTFDDLDFDSDIVCQVTECHLLATHHVTGFTDCDHNNEFLLCTKCTKACELYYQLLLCSADPCTFPITGVKSRPI